MKKIKYFFSKPRNIYYSMVLMLCAFSGLMSISFSYFVNPSNHNTKIMSLDPIYNVIESDSLVDNRIVIEPNENKQIVINVVSNNDFNSYFKLFYNSNNSINVSTSTKIDNYIFSHEVKKIVVNIQNKGEETETVEFGIVSGYNNELNVTGTELKSS